MSVGWSDLHAALDRLADTGRKAKFWLRDDDAVSHTPALRQLARWAVDHETDILLALVPSRAEESLQEAVGSTPQFVGAVHGWAHKNHAPETEKKQELGVHRPLDTVCAELKLARQRTLDVCGGRALPVLVPPWNRISSEVVRSLPDLGFAGLSTFSDAFTQSAIAGLKVANSHVDIIDWRGTRGGRPHSDLISEMMTAIEVRAPVEQPIGILTHHLVHDEAAWSFLDELGAALNRHPGACWISPMQVFSP